MPSQVLRLVCLQIPNNNFPSLPPDARNRPSALIATAFCAPFAFAYETSSLPVATSQNRIT